VRVLLEGPDCGRGRQALMEALRCCGCAEWPAVKVLRPLLTPGTAALRLWNGHWNEVTRLEMYFDREQLLWLDDSLPQHV
jgi:hypothetical protein